MNDKLASSVIVCWMLLVLFSRKHTAAAFLVGHDGSFRQRHETTLTRLNLDKGFNILETASKVVPQGQIVGTVKKTWTFAWKRMMAELAPQDKSGSYQRPFNRFDARIGSPKHPDEPERYHVYLGNPCPVRVNTALNVLKA